MDLSGAPAGDSYDWYVRALALLEQRNAGAAAELLAWVVLVEPDSRSGWEALGRAWFAVGRYQDAESAFRRLVEAGPDDDYARFGLGLTLWRQQRFAAAAEHLSLAVAMRPGRDDYRSALQQVRATIRARAEAGLTSEQAAGTAGPVRPGSPPSTGEGVA